MQLGAIHLIDSHRTRRTRDAGLRVCLLGSLTAALSAASALKWGHLRLAVGCLLIFTGCLASLAWTITRPGKRAFAWWPCYLGVWLSSLPALLLTGRSGSPFFTEYMILLYVGALVIQMGFSRKQVLAFTALNALGWLAVDSILGPPGVPALPTMFVRLCNLNLMTANLVCIHALIVTEDRLVRQAQVHSRDLAEAQSMLNHSKRLADVGNLVASTTHEIAQPIQVVSSSSALLARLLECESRDWTRLRALVSNIEESSRRATRLLKELKNFSRKMPQENERIDLRDAVRAIQTLTEFDLRGRRIALEVRMPDKPLWVRGDSIRIEQVLLNLVTNARDACEHVENPRITLRVQAVSRWARVEVANNGPEVPFSAQSRIFDAYFTTKGGGTGLGLSICARIVEQHEGRIIFSSEPRCTTFVVDLPRLGDLAATLAASAHLPR